MVALVWITSMFLNNISINYKLAFVKSIWNEQNFYNYDFYVQNLKLWQVHSIPYTRYCPCNTSSFQIIMIKDYMF